MESSKKPMRGSRWLQLKAEVVRNRGREIEPMCKEGRESVEWGNLIAFHISFPKKETSWGVPKGLRGAWISVFFFFLATYHGGPGEMCIPRGSYRLRARAWF